MSILMFAVTGTGMGTGMLHNEAVRQKRQCDVEIIEEVFGNPGLERTKQFLRSYEQ